MKNKFQISIVLILMALLVMCTRKEHTTSSPVLSDKNQRSEIMTEISSNHELMEEMMGHMVQNSYSMHALFKNDTLKMHMINNMMDLMYSDSSFCQDMQNRMMGNEHMKMMMMDMMNSESGCYTFDHMDMHGGRMHH